MAVWRGGDGWKGGGVGGREDEGDGTPVSISLTNTT